MQFLRNLSLTEYFKENPNRIRFAFPVTRIYISPLTFSPSSPLHYLAHVSRSAEVQWSPETRTGWPLDPGGSPPGQQLPSLPRCSGGTHSTQSRDSKGIPKLPLVQLILLHKIHCIKVSLEIPLLSLTQSTHAEQHWEHGVTKIVSDASTDQHCLMGCPLIFTHTLHLQHMSRLNLPLFDLYLEFKVLFFPLLEAKSLTQNQNSFLCFVSFTQ